MNLRPEMQRSQSGTTAGMSRLPATRESASDTMRADARKRRSEGAEGKRTRHSKLTWVRPWPGGLKSDRTETPTTLYRIS